MSCHWPWIKRRECIVQSPSIGPSPLAAACDIENEAEQLPSYIFDARAARRDSARVEIDKIGPLFRKRRARLAQSRERAGSLAG